jgi:hypothetical protein
MALWQELQKLAPEYEGLTPQQFVETLHREFAPQVPFDRFASKVQYQIPTNPSPLFSLVPDSVEAGIRNYQQGVNQLLGATGIRSPEEVAARGSELQRRQAEIAPQGAVKEGFDAVAAANEKGGWTDALGAVLSNPQILPRLIGESFGSFVPDLALAAVTGGLAAPIGKALALRLALPKVAPEVVAASTKMAITAGMVGAGSAKTEYASEVLETFSEAGLDLTTSDGFLKGLKDPELMAKAHEMGLRKGIPVGVFDALSMSLAGRILDPAFKAARAAGTPVSRGTLLGRGAAELGLQAGLGAAGEAAGQFAQTGDIPKKGEVLLEALAEVGTAPVEVYSNMRSAKKMREELEGRLEEERGAAEAEAAAQQEETQKRQAELDKPLVDDKRREQFDLSPTPVDDVIRDLSKRYGLNARETEAIISSPEDTNAFLNAVKTQDPDALKGYSTELLSAIENKTNEFAELAQAQPSGSIVGQQKADETRLNASLLEDSTRAPPPEDVRPLDAFGRPTTGTTAETIKKQIAYQLNLPEDARAELQAMSDLQLRPFLEEQVRQQPRLLDKVPDLRYYLNSFPDVSPARQLTYQPTQSAVGPIGQQQAERLVSQYKKDERFSSFINSDLSAQEKARLIVQELTSPQGSQIQKGGMDLDLATVEGQVATQAETRDDADFARYLAQSQQVSPEAATAAINAYRNAREADKDLNVPQLQQAVKAATGSPLPLKPAAALLAEIKNPTAYGPPTQGETPKGKTQWAPPKAPRGLAPEKWDAVLKVMRQTKPGQSVTLPTLRAEGLSLQEGIKAMDALRKKKILGGVEDARTDRAVPYDNALSPANSLLLSRNEFNGKNYGCL